MSYTDFQNMQLVGRRVPDYSLETDANGAKHQVELPGMFEVGFNLDGVFKSIYTFKVAGLLADIERFKKANPSGAVAPAPSEPPATTAAAPAATVAITSTQ